MSNYFIQVWRCLISRFNSDKLDVNSEMSHAPSLSRRVRYFLQFYFYSISSSWAKKKKTDLFWNRIPDQNNQHFILTGTVLTLTFNFHPTGYHFAQFSNAATPLTSTTVAVIVGSTFFWNSLHTSNQKSEVTTWRKRGREIKSFRMQWMSQISAYYRIYKISEENIAPYLELSFLRHAKDSKNCEKRIKIHRFIYLFRSHQKKELGRYERLTA